jgi:phage pi2 protein 07
MSVVEEVLNDAIKQESIYVDKSEYEKLKRHSLMLGRIASLVEDFCEEEDTTEMGVRRILSELYFRRSEDLLK